MLTATESNPAPECYCDVLPHEDWDQCPAHGTAAQEAKAQQAQARKAQGHRRVSVGRTQPLWESASECTAIDEIWEAVERMYFDGRITWQQRGFFRWAARKAQETESRCCQCGAPVQEL
jgi:hypothetical protein